MMWTFPKEVQKTNNMMNCIIMNPTVRVGPH